MDKKPDISEIANRKKVLSRREGEAGLSAGDATVGGLIPSTEKGKGQGDFLYKPKPKPKTAEDEARKRSDFLKLQRKRDSEIVSSNDQFEEEFSKDSSAPLTDSVRAARAAVGAGAAKENMAYAEAYNEEQKSAA